GWISDCQVKLPPRRSLEVPLDTIPNASLGSPKTITNERASYVDPGEQISLATFNLKPCGSIIGGPKVARLQNATGVVLRLRGVQVGFNLSLNLSGMTVAIGS